MWQDLVFLVGSTLSIVFLAPTLQDESARIPLGSSVPSLTVGSVYALTYATMGMTFSAVGSVGVAIMWSLIASYRSPGPRDGPVNIPLFFGGLFDRVRRTPREASPDREPRESGHAPAGD